MDSAVLDHETLELIQNTLRQFARRRLDDSQLLAYDRDGHCPEPLIRELLGEEVGLHLAFIPTAYGGLGAGARAIFRICEQMAGIDLGLATSLLGVSLGSDPLRVGGTDEQKQHWLGRVAEHGLVVAYAVTEPGAGSDLASIRTRAHPVREAGRTVAYELEGNKQFITNGGIADLFTVLALAPGGPSFFVVERGSPGLEPGPPEHKHGIRASNTTALALDRVRVPADHLIGAVEGQGLAQATRVFGYTRVMVAAFGLGCGSAALERAIAYGRERVQDGSPLSHKPAWTHKLIVPHAAALEAARAYIEALVDRLDRGQDELQVEGAVAKLAATEAGNAAAEAAIQAHGGYGYIHDYMVEKLKRDVRITCIYEGTSEILQRTIARDRWRRHLQSRGEHYRAQGAALRALAGDSPECGALAAGLGCEALAEILEAARQARLTRNQHVLFALGALMARCEVATAFAHKAATGRRDSARRAPECLAAMSRIFARSTTHQLGAAGLELVAGAGALDGAALREFEGRLGLTRIHDGLVGQLADMALVAEHLTAA